MLTETLILIPCHSLEDFPSELGEAEAASLLNAFAVAWHPQLLAQSRSLPRWERADEPDIDVAGKLVIVPLPSESWLAGGWISRAESEGAAVVVGHSDRSDLLQAALEAVASPDPAAEASIDSGNGPTSAESTESGTPADGGAEPDASQAEPDEPLAETRSAPATSECDPELAADFMAFGFCHLMIELLTRHMHYFSSLDEGLLEREAVAAADAALVGDHTAAQRHLKSCFESLLECRERFYPVDCYLIDLCLVIPRLVDEHFRRYLESTCASNLLVSAGDLQEIATDHPELVTALREALTDTNRLNVVGADLLELPSPVIPLEAWLWDLRAGLAAYEELLGQSPRTWGRRRYGFTTLLPQVLVRHGFHSALHVALDDGVYPDAEHSKVQWEGCDGTVIDALTRIPLAADSATSFLRLPARLAESMEEDQVAALMLARWPEMQGPWLTDLQRIARFAPVLGRFLTLDDFIDQTDVPGRLSNYDESEYLSPFLVQFVAQEFANPVSRFRDFFQRHARFESADWMNALAALLSGRSPEAADEIQQRLEQSGPDAETIDPDVSEALDAHFQRGLDRLKPILLAEAGDASGWLVLNPLSFPRRVWLELPQACALEAAGVHGQQQLQSGFGVLVDVPQCGFTWLPKAADPLPAQPASAKQPPLAEDLLLRNEKYEVQINELTGGIARVKEYGRRPNRLSQQVGFRFLTEKVIPADDPDAVPEKTFYAAMRLRHAEVTHAGPVFGEIVCEGEILDESVRRSLAGYRQVVRIWRGRPVVEIELTLNPETLPKGSPWATYYGCRFAWNDADAALTRSVLGSAHGIRGERFEAPHYLEIADDQTRTTIVFHGMPFHRRTGQRMLDTVLIAEGESARTFRFTICLDSQYPQQSALDAMVTPVCLPVSSVQPRSPQGWFLHVSARNVQLTRVLPPVAGDAKASDRPACCVRLVETEGRSTQVRLQAFRAIQAARFVDPRRQPLDAPPVEDGAVRLEMPAYGIVDLELSF